MRLLYIALIVRLLSGCGGTDLSADSVTARVVSVTDGDTIRVEIGGETYSVRYVGVNTPEVAHRSGEVSDPCGEEATEANRRLVEGREVRLERDASDTDRYDRLLRYIYVGDTFVNEALVRDGYAEVVLYEPDDREFENFRQLEQLAARNNLGCHPTGIFDDGTYAR